MNYFEVSYTTLGGLGLFFLGLKYLSDSLQSSGRDVIKRILESLTRNRVLAVLAGLFITVFVQSSTITTVMTVSLVNAGLMELRQAIGVILGANVGTTATGWLISIKVGGYGMLLIGLGIFPMFAAKRQWLATLGKTLVALGLIFAGLQVMSGAFAPLRDDENFIAYLQVFDATTWSGILACVATACVLTIVIQSSSAMLGITMTLAATGLIDFHTAVALVIGENLGTVVTTQLAAIGTTTAAVRTARAHAIFNLIAAAAVLVVFPYFVDFIEWIVPGPANALAEDGTNPNIAWHIAVAHTMYNIINVTIWIPLIGVLARIVTWLVPQKEEKEVHKLKYLGNKAIVGPEVALQQATLEMDNLVDITREMFQVTRDYVSADEHDQKMFDRVNRLEDITDNIEEEMINFITHVLTGSITREQSRRGYGLMRMADELESIADSLQAFSIYRSRLFKRKEDLSADAWEDILSFFNEVEAYFNRLTRARMQGENIMQVRDLLKEAKSIKKLAKTMRSRHLDRLREGSCQPVTAQTYSDMFMTLQRIKNHSINYIEAYVGL